MTPQHLTLAEVISANDRALADGTLGAFAGKTECKYVYEDGCGCAIGVALSPETKAKITPSLQSDTIFGLSATAIITCEESSMLAVLQRLHDKICDSNRGGEYERAELEKQNFLDYLAQLRSHVNQKEPS